MPYLLLPLYLLLVPMLCGAAAQPDSSPPPDAPEVARQVYFVNHFFGMHNARFGDKKHPMVLIDLNAKSKAHIMTMVRQLNNDYRDGTVRARDLAIFTSGKLKGTGILVTVYEDSAKSMSFSIWLPALRKIRRHSEPDQGDSWGGSLFTYGDIYLRRPEDEQHELLEQAAFPDCLQPMQLAKAQGNRYTRRLPQPRCDVKGKNMLRLKSSTRFINWWYDYRILWVDPTSFADYRSEYFKDGRKVKVVDKDWRSMGLDDPRAQYWDFWSGRDLRDGRGGMAFIPTGYVFWNEKVKPRLWTEATLRKIKR